MEFIPKDRILKTNPNTLEEIRKQYKLDKPGQMKEAVNILRDWVQKQNHFKKKDFSEQYYELSIIGCKGSIERAKKRIDIMCTMRTLLPQFFGNYNVKTDFGDLNEYAFVYLLPKLTHDNYRVITIKLLDTVPKPSQIMDYFRSNIIVAEYVKAHDYMNGFIYILDFSEANVMGYVTKISPLLIRQILSILIEGFGMKIQAIHIITQSKLIDTFVTILKQILSAKVAGRIQIHETIEKIHEYIPKSILPEDYGGEERSLKELKTEFIEALSSEEHLKYMREMNEAVIDETCRQEVNFNEQYAGMPGTFRLLSID